MKKIIAFLFSLVLCISSLGAFAATTAEVYAEETKLVLDNTVLIPVEIKNNTGLMGFKITVDFPAEIIDVVSVSRGVITKKGSFNTNLNVHDGTFDILWNSDGDISGDGSLFVLGVRAVKCFDNEKIKLSFSKEDTFNESWDDVTFSCKDIDVSCAEENTVETTVAESAKAEVGVDGEKVSSVLSSDQLINMVKTTLEQLNYNSLEKVKDEDEFLHVFNDNVNKITANKFPMYEKFRDVVRAYNDAYESYFIMQATQLADASDIKAAIESAKNKYKIDDLNVVDEKTQKKFIKKVEENIRTLNDGISEISKDVDTKTAMTTLKKLYGSLAIVDASDVTENVENSDNNWTSYALYTVGALVAITVTFFVVKKISKKKG